MKIFTYLDRDGQQTAAACLDDQCFKLEAAIASVNDLIHETSEDPDPIANLKRLVKRYGRVAIDPTTVSWSAPIPVPRRNIFCVGWNYAKHYAEGNGRDDAQLPDWPTFFTKPTTTVIGPGSSIAHDAELSSQFDYEAELAVVIGRAGRGISEEHALDYVFGYMLANDVSVRDVQWRHGGQWFKGKALDSSCPTGPWIVTRDEVADPQSLSFTCELNGTVVQRGYTGDMIFSVARLIAELSLGMTLLPGDIILTGTPDGVGAHRDPPRFLMPGDRVSVRCPTIGVLENTVVTTDLHSPHVGSFNR